MYDGFSLLSHPKKLLIAHLKNVGDFSKTFSSELFSYVPRNIFDIYENSSKKLGNASLEKIFADISYLIGVSHDFGKATSFFQEYIQGIRQSSSLTNHSLISSLFTLIIVEEYIQKRLIKSENGELIPILLYILPYFSSIIVRKHHSNLHNFADEIKKRFSNPNNVLQTFNNMTQQPEFKMIFQKLITEKFHFLIYEKIVPKVEEVTRRVARKESLLNLKSASGQNVYRLLMRFFSPSKFSEKNLAYYFSFRLLYAILLETDKMDATFDSKYPKRPVSPNFMDVLRDFRTKKGFDKKNNISFIDEKRCEIYSNVLEEITRESKNLKQSIKIINVPTGMGKTLTSLGAAFFLRNINEKKCITPPRIIYCLPFLSIIDQNFHVLREIFNDFISENNNPLLLSHHHLSEMTYSQKSDLWDMTETEFTGGEARLLIEGWDSEITVTTFHQFFNTLFSNRNNLIRRFVKYPNSIIILDEIQTIPLQYWKLIGQILKFLKRTFKMEIFFVSATIPKIIPFNSLWHLYPDEPRTELFSSLDRIKYHINLKPLKIEELASKVFLSIIEELRKSEKETLKWLVVLNTRNSAKKFHSEIEYLLKNKSSQIIQKNKIKLKFLSSEILPLERLNIINEIKNNDEKNYLLISTQVVEAGVDLDFNKVYRDFGPLDSIIQVAGRCNRNGKQASSQGLVFIHKLMDKKNNAFASYIYDSNLLRFTEEILSTASTVSEKDIFPLIVQYYKKIDEYFSAHKSQKLLKAINGLQFEQIGKNFNLIEKIETVAIFLEWNDEATEIWKEYMDINENLRKYEKKNALLNLQAKLNTYTINIHLNINDKTKLSNKMNQFALSLRDGQINYIPHKLVNRFYSNTGLQLQ